MKRIVRITSLGLLYSLLSCSPSSTPGDSLTDSGQRVIEVEARTDRGRSEEHNLEFEARWNELYNTPHDKRPSRART